MAELLYQTYTDAKLAFTGEQLCHATAFSLCRKDERLSDALIAIPPGGLDDFNAVKCS